MLPSALSSFPGLALSVEVRRFEHTTSTYALVAVAVLKDGSVLFVRDYLFADGTHKYSYHWQRESGERIGRWDNEAHWSSISTFPHHFHPASGAVEASSVRCVDDALRLIATALGGSTGS